MFTDLEQAQQYVQDNEVQMVDLKFCDLRGQWRHVTIPAGRFDRSLMEDGVGFDGSSVGFKSVKAGDMILVPDLSTALVPSSSPGAEAFGKEKMSLPASGANFSSPSNRSPK